MALYRFDKRKTAETEAPGSMLQALSLQQRVTPELRRKHAQSTPETASSDQESLRPATACVIVLFDLLWI